MFTDKINSFITAQKFVRVKDVKVGKTQTHFKDNELNFLIDNLNPFKVYINVSDNETLKSSLRIFNKAFKNNIELQITTFYYRIFLLFTQIWNLENECSYFLLIQVLEKVLCYLNYHRMILLNLLQMI
jgi:hypothetical protein